MVLFIIFAVCVVLQSINLIWAQKRKEKKRVAMGLPAKIHDHSMDVNYKAASEDHDQVHGEHGEIGLADKTDGENPYFT